MNIALKITYDGKNFCGWQKQPSKRSVQEEIEKAIFLAFNKTVNLEGSGRTDSGVHAMGQVANFEIDENLSTATLPRAINYYLPEDIKVIEAKEVSSDFNARFSAKEKTYIYKFYASRFELPLKQGRELRVNDYVDVSLMQKALKYIIGEKDFRSFCAKKSGKTNFVRKIISAKINVVSDFEYELEITGNGFLYNMVRIIMGTLLMVGYSKWKIDDIKAIIDAKDRTKAGKTMPAYALYLKEVKYN
ncbi:MAG: tRNA pseudouridine(38-40) synthase TruA [Clostridia bacterium]|nr:tRNA pseudouridine(38-40) synthase TruA [Clostridia bacterium]